MSAIPPGEGANLPATMKAVVTIGNGGYDKLVYRDVEMPLPRTGEVLVRVLAAGINNTEINTRLGWYSASVTESTADVAGIAIEAARPDGGWNAKTPFPLIQGTDCCGIVIACGPTANTGLIGRRVLVRPCMRPHGFGSPENIWMASDFDGAFAQFVRVPEKEVFAVECGWSDAELATIPCAYGTAENMLHRAGLRAGQHVLVTGASGGVGSATLQLAKRRGAYVTAVTTPAKADQLRAIGADRILDRDADLVAQAGESMDLVVDNVAGPAFGSVLRTLKRGGRYVSSGAIAGPVVTLDMRDFYLRDLTLIGCTAWDEPVFPNLVTYIERGEIRPLLAGTFPLAEIARAQSVFLEKKHVGNFVLIPPPVGG
ncbi:NADPH:quinone reductase-like Zn-dependent oxidoreductase [Dongia mobilis]|uniref:NADPH:quinone reductase-like Zn-dependent oxidoreductase n=1 Tax=Dongia mobilis TaxID=578943 RepID=A0A4R6WEZ8_9PROT|nr:alcohol dehydrogenase family protein [Dongia mobilis]TDQ78465.1 NADPH:quinone reductase-like Zn-dependent oxidoreductase [Dongia mobilis]